MKPRRACLVVCDALQRDFINEIDTPTLSSLRREAAVFESVTGVFPSMTRVTSASIATGCWPGTHGLIGNNVVLDAGEGLACFSVAAPDFVERLRRITGRTLQRPVLAERIRPRGHSMVFSNVSAGAAYFQDPDGHGFVFHRAGSLGPGRRPIASADGLNIQEGAEGDATMTKRFCREMCAPDAPMLGVLWLSEPDHSGHLNPLGSPAHRDGLRAADRCVARVLASLREQIAAGSTLLVVCSDHGMQTIREEIDLTACLVQAGFKESAHSSDVVVAPNGTAALIHIAASARTRIPDIHRFLQAQPWSGRVWSGPALAELQLTDTGTLGIAVTSSVHATVNEHGNAGSCTLFSDPLDPKCYIGHGMHGGTSDAELSPFLMVLGGGFTPGLRHTPASVIDIAPTVLRHFGMSVDGCDGTPLPTV